MDDPLTPDDLDLLLAALHDERQAMQFAQWISEGARQNSLARDREVDAALVAFRKEAEAAPGTPMDGRLSASHLGLLFSALARSRRTDEDADWYSEEMRQESLARTRAVEQKLTAHREKAGPAS